MIISTLSQQEEYQQTANHLDNIVHAYMDIIPDLAHFYSVQESRNKKLQTDRVWSKKKRERDIWKKDIIFCPKCGIVLKNKFYVNSKILLKKRKGHKQKQIFLVCKLCRHANFLYYVNKRVMRS